MASSVLRLWRADTGAFLGKADVGSGLRAKSWLEEVPRFLLEAATARGLTRDGYGVLANFPAFLDGSKTQSKPIGESLSAKALNSAEIFLAVPQTQNLGTGDGVVVDFGSEPLTQPDPTVIDYGNTGSDGTAPPDPRGAQSPAFLLGDAGPYNLAATDGILTIIVNGQSYSVDVGVGAATTSLALVASIVAAGIPVRAYDNDTGQLLLTTIGLGRSQNLMVDDTAGTAGAVIYATSGGVVVFGNGGPLNQMDNSDVVGGVKPQRLLLPLQTTIELTMGGELIVVSETSLGVLEGSNLAGTATVTGTIDNTTGAISLTTAGDAPDNATSLTAFFKALIPIVLSEEVRIPIGGGDLAILVR